MSRHRVEVEYHLRESGNTNCFLVQNTVSGNCDGFEKEKILKTSRVAEPNYLQYSKKGRRVFKLKKKKKKRSQLLLNSL